jgi:hypothetical protein
LSRTSVRSNVVGAAELVPAVEPAPVKRDTAGE